MNFEKRVVIDANQLSWQKSPESGIWRKPLARAEVERCHVTSVVKYDAGAYYKEHSHPNGEEIFVLDGVFSDETGDYQAGSYLRNTEGFTHSPFSLQGCTIFFKLYQFQSNDNEQVRINSNQANWLKGQGNLKVMPLHSFKGESTALVHWPAGERFVPHTHMSGEEIYVIRGELIDEHGRYPAGSWIRSPHLSQHHPYVESDTVILVKVGHL